MLRTTAHTNTHKHVNIHSMGTGSRNTQQTLDLWSFSTACNWQRSPGCRNESEDSLKHLTGFCWSYVGGGVSLVKHFCWLCQLHVKFICLQQLVPFTAKLALCFPYISSSLCAQLLSYCQFHQISSLVITIAQYCVLLYFIILKS